MNLAEFKASIVSLLSAKRVALQAAFQGDACMRFCGP